MNSNLKKKQKTNPTAADIWQLSSSTETKHHQLLHGVKLKTKNTTRKSLGTNYHILQSPVDNFWHFQSIFPFQLQSAIKNSSKINSSITYCTQTQECSSKFPYALIYLICILATAWLKHPAIALLLLALFLSTSMSQNKWYSRTSISWTPVITYCNILYYLIRSVMDGIGYHVPQIQCTIFYRQAKFYCIWKSQIENLAGHNFSSTISYMDF